MADTDHLADQPILLEEDHLRPPPLHPRQEALVLEGDHPVGRVTAEHVHMIRILASNFLAEKIGFLSFKNVGFSFYSIGIAGFSWNYIIIVEKSF